MGDGIAGIIAGAKGNIVTHVGDGITAAILGGKANILTKVGDGPHRRSADFKGGK